VDRRFNPSNFVLDFIRRAGESIAARTTLVGDLTNVSQ